MANFIKLPGNKVLAIDGEDRHLISGRRIWRHVRGVVVELTPKPHRTYALLARLIAGAQTRSQVVRFINGDRFDHRRSNLVVVDRSTVSAKAYKKPLGRIRKLGDHRWQGSFRDVKRVFPTSRAVKAWILDQRREAQSKL